MNHYVRNCSSFFGYSVNDVRGVLISDVVRYLAVLIASKNSTVHSFTLAWTSQSKNSSFKIGYSSYSTKIESYSRCLPNWESSDFWYFPALALVLLRSQKWREATEGNCHQTSFAIQCQAEKQILYHTSTKPKASIHEMSIQ